MNKSSPEYIRIREEIAKKIWKIKYPKGTKWEELFNSEDLKDTNPAIFRKFADSILAIKGIAILADNQRIYRLLPFRLIPNENNIFTSMLKVICSSPILRR